jgi:hypothetical protein
MRKLFHTRFLFLSALRLLSLSVFFIVPSACEKSPNCVPIGACWSTPDPGPCLAAITKYYYDPVAKECKSFTWGGCGGRVPFETLEECKICECRD